MNDVFNWVAMIEIPIFLALFKCVMRFKKEVSQDVVKFKGSYDEGIFKCREDLSEFKLHVAKNYVSIGYLKDVENRLTNHLLRIEKKLDEVGRLKL